MKNLCFVLLISFAILGGGFFVHIEAQSDICKQGQFNSDCYFPTWDSKENPAQVADVHVQGVIGQNQDGGFIMAYIPKIIDILLKFVAPLVTLMLLWSGVRFIMAGNNEEDIQRAKDFFVYGVIGVAFVVMSYSLLKFIYFILAQG